MNKVVQILVIVAGLLLVGTLGFWSIEGWSLVDSLYMSVITLTTVGFKEVHDLSVAGQLFTVLYLIVGMGIFFYEVAQLGEIVVRAEIGKWMGRRRMDTKLRGTRNHFIICGFGRLGSRLCKELSLRKLPFIVVEKDPSAYQICRDAGWPCITGDATEDETLIAAGIEHAKGLATVLSTEADNLYVILSARLLSKDVRLLSRAATEKGAEKMLKAGANQVISLYETGATKMAQLLAHPNVDDFMKVISTQGKTLDLAEVQVTAKSSFSGKQLQEGDLRQRGIIIVGIRRAKGEVLLLPRGSDVAQEGDYLIALGEAAAIADLINNG